MRLLTSGRLVCEWRIAAGVIGSNPPNGRENQQLPETKTDATKEHGHRVDSGCRLDDEVDRLGLRALLDTLPVGAFVLDAAGGIRYANDAFMTQWGEFPSTESVDDYGPYKGWFSDGRRIRAEEWPAARAIKGEAVPLVEIEIEAFDGTRRVLLTSTAPILSAQGYVIGAVGVNQDVTQTRAGASKKQAFEILESLATFSLAGLGPHDFALAVCDSLARQLGLLACSFWRIDEGAGLLRQVAQVGFTQTVRPVVPAAGTDGGHTALTGERVIRSDTLSPDMPTQSREVTDLLGPGAKSYVTLPLTAEKRVIGVLIPVWNRPREFDAEELETLSRLAGMFAVGYDRARLLRAEQRRQTRIEALHGVLESGVTSLDVHASAQAVLDSLPTPHDFDLSSIWLVREDHLELIAQVGYPPEFDRPVPLSGPSDMALAVREGHPVVVTDPSNNHVIQVYEAMGIPLRSYAVFPLVVRDRSIGVLALVWTEKKELDNADIEFYESVADQVAVVLENARLYEAEHGTAERLKTQAAERQRWLSGISHDLRTPLATIRGYAELLSTEDGLDDEFRRQTGIILAQSKRIQGLISDMLLAFQIEGGKLPVDLQRTDLAEVLSNVEEVVRTDPRFVGRDVTFSADLRTHYSRIDFSHFSRAVLNVVINALNHNPSDTAVLVNLRESDGANEITVVDNGDGIDEKTLTRVWDRFARGISSSQDTDGVGLGMATTRHLVELMGGTITIASTVGVGTTVTMRFPEDE